MNDLAQIQRGTQKSGIRATVSGPDAVFLSSLLAGLEGRISGESSGVLISSITADSRQVKPGSLFVALAGLTVDGHDFVEKAVALGCEAVVVEKGRGRGGSGPVMIEVDDSRKALSLLAAAFYRQPARELKLIGITGTNGKTTSTYLLEAIVRANGGVPGVIGTIGYRFGGRETAAPYTTPEPVALQALLRRMADSGVTHVIMEVSSHALAQERLYGLTFDAGLFTNLSRDHLDFHQSMEAYYQAKKKFFSCHLKKEAVRVIVLDGEPQDAGHELSWPRRLAQELAQELEAGNGAGSQQPLITCGLRHGLIQTPRFRNDFNGIEAELTLPGAELHLHSPLVGEFNLYNLLGAVGIAWGLGFDKAAIARGLGQVSGVPGRLERITVAAPGFGSHPRVFVDYAHTPDALAQVLTTLRRLRPARLILLFGCGGDRDRGKRPLMGAVAGKLADVVILTSDNPRSESAALILHEIEAGLLDGASKPLMARMRAEVLLQKGGHGYDIIESRHEAIQVAISGAGAEDVVLVSGKGHETYQIDRRGSRFFDDRVQVREQLQVVPC